VSEVAKENGLHETVLEKIDAKGGGADGKKQGDALPVPDKLIGTGFTLGKGAASQLIETPDGSFAIVGVKEVYPSEQRPFSAVRGQVLARWTTERTLKSLGEKAAKITERLKAGEAFDKIAAEFHRPVQTTGLIKRGEASAKAGLEGGLLTALFSLDGAGQATAVSGDNGVTVISLLERKIEAAADAKKETEQMQAVLERALRQDMLEQYRLHLMKEYKVRVNDQLLASMYAPKENAGETEE
jgi:peptidyl-prolyl cis-trans isomerase D